MRRVLISYLLAALGIAAIAWLNAALLPVLGLASAALLFLLPVTLSAAQGGLGPGLFAALAATLAYNYFLLPPRYSFHIHGAEDFVSALVLAMVALITSRLATRLKAREVEAMARAEASEELAELSAILAAGEPQVAADEGVKWVAQRFGAVRLIGAEGVAADDAAFSSLDLSAAAWALHNGDVTGHGTPIMPAAEWSFLPLAPKRRAGGGIAAIARPASGETRSEAQLAHLRQVALLLGQASDRAALERESRERERLEAGERLRRAFLASLAHDFRTPLTVIAGRLESLARESDEAADALGAARRLDRMMDDLIGAARMEEGTLAVKTESLDLVDVVGAAAQAAAMPDSVALERDIPADLPFVRGDAVLLQHALVNLIDNAGRHARRRVNVRAEIAGQSVVLAVSDDGPGIPEDERERVFDRFARLEGSDREDGSGLGLAIVRGFAEAMGMTVAIDAAPGGGACFSVTMPISGTA